MNQPSSGNGEDSVAPAAGPTRPGVPRWVKTFGIVTAALLLILLLIMIISGGQHGPGRHRPSSLGLTAAAVPAASVASNPAAASGPS